MQVYQHDVTKEVVPISTLITREPLNTAECHHFPAPDSPSIFSLSLGARHLPPCQLTVLAPSACNPSNLKSNPSVPRCHPLSLICHRIPTIIRLQIPPMMFHLTFINNPTGVINIKQHHRQ
jgi:hypothetical protein